MPHIFEKETTIEKLGMHTGDLRARVSLRANMLETVHSIPAGELASLVQDAILLGRFMALSEPLVDILNQEDQKSNTQ